MKRILLIVVAFVMAGCGGGGGASSSSVTSVKVSPVGGYSLVQITEQKSRTLYPFEAYSTLTSTPPAWTGSLKAGSTSWDETMTSAENKTSLKGSYSFTSGANLTGTFDVSVPGVSGLSGTYTILDDSTLQLNYNADYLPSGRYDQWTETWKKISN